ncbi:hypothetical protein SAMN05880590_11195 [Rhizobium sp. RU35A]|uniref:hypothetical protein n=1 Tax=Rhizobium sp. RU35A TaxID=1907414 RepID=UPI000953CE19|nr:hypothetical protein [Rhizobium sp. RU35A]SIR06657.1 hypothetical protein SAMN05880590_11195 [Rhizobium sp. RU35A]
MRMHYENMPSEEIFRRVREMDGCSASASYDPIFTPIFTGFFSTTLGWSATAATLGGVLASAVVTTSVSEGVNRK